MERPAKHCRHAAVAPLLSNSRRIFSTQSDELVFCHDKVAQYKHRHDLCRIFRQFFVAYLTVTKQVFDDVKRMHNFRPNACLCMIKRVKHCA